MFCQKCGAQISENARFCAACGTNLKQPMKKNIGSKSSLFFWGVALCIIVFIIVICLILGQQNQTEDKQSPFTSKKEEQQKTLEDERYLAKTIEITDGTTLYLEGTYPNLQKITSNGNVYFEGEFPMLKEVKLEGTEGDTLEFMYHKETEFPSLQTLYCGKLVPDEELQNELFDVEKYFPSLKTVSLELSNSKVDFFFLSCIYEFQKLQEQGELLKFTYMIHHEESDFLGTWVEENDLLSFSFREDGTVRIADSTGLFGAEVMTYTWVDDKTLALKAKGSGIFDFLSIELQYEMLGNYMWIKVLGKDYRLERKIE